MRFTVITLFPEIFEGFVGTSLIGKARERGLVDIELVNLRDFAPDRHHTADDAPYGGGPGMVMLGEPILAALERAAVGRKVLLTPWGRTFDQPAAERLAGQDAITLLCGRYEGLDERVRGFFDEEISIGDYVLAGGEVAAMAIMDAVSRLVPGVLGNAESLREESFASRLLEYPQYTRPEVLRGLAVPEVLRSGDHERIRRWRRFQALRITQERRPDLFAKLDLTEEDLRLLASGEP